MLFTRICGGSFSSSAPGSLFNHWLLICVARFEPGRIFLYPGSQGKGKKDKNMKNSILEENVRKMLEVNKKIHAMGLDVWVDNECIKHIIKNQKDQYGIDRPKIVGYVDNNFNIVINE